MSNVTILLQTPLFTISEHEIAGKRHEFDIGTFYKDGNALNEVQAYLLSQHGITEKDYTIDSGMCYKTIHMNIDHEFFTRGEWYDLDMNFRQGKIRMYQDK